MTSPGAVWRRARAYLRRPDVSEAPLRFLWRRVRYEAERRIAPGRLGRERLVRFDEGLRIWVRLVDVVDLSIYLYGAHEYVATRVFTALTPRGGIVADVGGHLGAFTLLAARRVGPEGRVFAFEPNPPSRQRLERNVAVNGLSNVRVLPEALSDRTGTATLLLSGDASRSGNASLSVGDGVDGSAGTAEVQAARLDDVLEREGVTRLDLVKIDVEGLEDRVVAGGRGILEALRPAVLFEVNDLTDNDSGTSAPAIDALRGLGYAMYGMSLNDGGVRLTELQPGEDPRPYREPWSALNLLGLHPDSEAHARVPPASFT